MQKTCTQKVSYISDETPLILTITKTDNYSETETYSLREDGSSDVVCFSAKGAQFIFDALKDYLNGTAE